MVPDCGWGTCLPVTHSTGCKCSAAALSRREDKAQPLNESCAQLCLTHETLEQDRSSSFMVWECETYTQSLMLMAAQDLKVSLEAFDFDYHPTSPASPAFFLLMIFMANPQHPCKSFPGLLGWLQPVIAPHKSKIATGLENGKQIGESLFAVSLP